MPAGAILIFGRSAGLPAPSGLADRRDASLFCRARPAEAVSRRRAPARRGLGLPGPQISGLSRRHGASGEICRPGARAIRSCRPPLRGSLEHGRTMARALARSSVARIVRGPGSAVKSTQRRYHQWCGESAVCVDGDRQSLARIAESPEIDGALTGSIPDRDMGSRMKRRSFSGAEPGPRRRSGLRLIVPFATIAAAAAFSLGMVGATNEGRAAPPPVPAVAGQVSLSPSGTIRPARAMGRPARRSSRPTGSPTAVTRSSFTAASMRRTPRASAATRSSPTRRRPGSSRLSVPGTATSPSPGPSSTSGPA